MCPALFRLGDRIAEVFLLDLRFGLAAQQRQWRNHVVVDAVGFAVEVDLKAVLRRRTPPASEGNDP